MPDSPGASPFRLRQIVRDGLDQIQTALAAATTLIDSKIAELQSVADTAETAITASEDDRAQLRAMCDQHGTDIAALQQAVTDLTGRVTALEQAATPAAPPAP